MDEGWTRWVLEQYEFGSSPIHNAEIRAGALRQKFDAIILADQSPREIVDGNESTTIRPEYRGGIGEAGVANLRQFVADGGTLIFMGSACDLAIERLAVPVRNGKGMLSRDQHFAPGAILRIQVDTTDPLGYGMAPETFGFYVNSPFFSLPEGPATHRTEVVASYASNDVLASGLLKGEELMAGRAAVVAVDMSPGRVVLFGLRPQHRARRKSCRWWRADWPTTILRNCSTSACLRCARTGRNSWKSSTCATPPTAPPRKGSGSRRSSSRGEWSRSSRDRN